jgi:putative FmdB family regulatory protein
MPLYEYECENGHRFELIRKFSDPPLEACPTCGARARKLMSSPAIQFKGTGWYITDYAKKESASAGKGEKSEKSDKADAGTSTAGETKSDAKADAKTETKTETAKAGDK